MIKKIENDHELYCILKGYMDKYNIDRVTIPPGEYRCLEIFHLSKSDLKINLFSSSPSGDNFIRIMFRNASDASNNSIIYISFKCPNEYKYAEIEEIVANIDMKQPEKNIIDNVMCVFMPKSKHMEMKYNLK